MSQTYILAVDQGTTSTRALLFDKAGHIHGIAQIPLRQHYPQPGWVEHDAEEIWHAVQQVIKDVIERAKVSPTQVAAIGITNQRETTVMWDRHTGRPLHRAVVWQSRQTVEICDAMTAAGAAPMIREKTGLPIDPYFSASKIAWLLQTVDGARDGAERGDVLFGTVDSWLVWNLTGGAAHVTDATNASRTMLFNIHSLEWDEELLTLFDIPKKALPTVKSSSECYGYTHEDLLDGTRIPVTGMAGDQHAALFGQACFSPGMAKNTYGTGCFLLMQTGSEAVRSDHGLLTTIAWQLGDTVSYALEGSVFVSGAAVQWLRDGLGIIESAEASEALAKSVESSDGVYVVPAFTGMGAPYWDSHARGAIYGLTRGTTAAHIARATLEAIGFQTRDLVLAMEQDSGVHLKRLRVDGGAVQNNLLMQIQADILGVPVDRPVVQETTALGAAYLAGLAVGYWGNTDEIAANWHLDEGFESSLDKSVRDGRWQGWLDAIRRTRSHP